VNLSLGAEGKMTIESAPDDVQLTTIVGLFRMRYYW
jgi:hypothetical protein